MDANINADCYYKFTFGKGGPEESIDDCTFTVYTENLNVLNTFLSQHNFDMSTIKVDVITDIEDIANIEQSEILVLYHFGSNKNNEVFDIYSTITIIDYISTLILDQLIYSLSFGKILKRIDELEFMTYIDNLLSFMPHSTLINDESDDYPDECDMIYQTFIEFTDPSYSFRDDMSDFISDITIEAYVQCFVSIMMDIYK